MTDTTKARRAIETRPNFVVPDEWDGLANFLVGSTNAMLTLQCDLLDELRRIRDRLPPQKESA